MRIIQVYDGHERVAAGEGSVPSGVYQLSKHLARAGHELQILERRWAGTPAYQEVEGMEFHRFDIPICSRISNREIVYREIRRPSGALKIGLDRLYFSIKLHRYLKHQQFDILHVHLPFAANILINLNRNLRRKLVYTAHLGEERMRLGLDPNFVWTRIFSPDLYLIKRSRKVIVLNPQLKSKLVSLGVNPDSIEVIGNGIDVNEYSGFSQSRIYEIKQKYGIPELTTVMFAGSVIPRKGVEYLIRAAEILNSKDLLWLIAGRLDLDTKYASKLILLARRAGINAKFLGFVPHDELKILDSICDIFVMPSLEEGFGMALLEALASGKPVVGTNVGGIPLQIKHGWNGFLVEPANQEQLAKAISYLVDHPEERIRMGRNSRKLAEDEFSWDRIAKKYLEVYAEIIG